MPVQKKKNVWKLIEGTRYIILSEYIFYGNIKVTKKFLPMPINFKLRTFKKSHWLELVHVVSLFKSISTFIGYQMTKASFFKDG